MCLTNGGVVGEKLKSKGIAVHELSFSFFNLLKNIVFIKNRLACYKPDLIQTWMYHSDLLGSFITFFSKRKYKVYWNIRNSSLENVGYNTKIVVRILALISKIVPSKIISCSKVAADLHMEMGYDSSKIEIIPNGIEIEKLDGNNRETKSFRSLYKVSESTYLIGCVARLHPQKDHGTLIRAFSEVIKEEQNCKLVLVGKGISSSYELLNLANKFNISEKVLLIEHSEDIEFVYRSLDLKVLSSSSGEGFPNVLIEAMAHGVPCIASDVGDSKYIIHDKNYIFSPGDFSRLAEQILAALQAKRQNSRKLKLLIKKNEERVRKFYTIDIMAARYSSIWENI